MSWRPRIYIAGGSSERHKIAEIIDALKAAGWEVTYDWTRNKGWEDPSHPEARDAHIYCLAGIRACHLFWYIAPPSKSEGAHAELGFAFGIGRTVLASGADLDGLGRVFPRVADYRIDSVGKALSHLISREAFIFSRAWPDFFLAR